jgi:hypothetical protein
MRNARISPQCLLLDWMIPSPLPLPRPCVRTDRTLGAGSPDRLAARSAWGRNAPGSLGSGEPDRADNSRVRFQLKFPNRNSSFGAVARRPAARISGDTLVPPDVDSLHQSAAEYRKHGNNRRKVGGCRNVDNATAA